MEFFQFRPDIRRNDQALDVLRIIAVAHRDGLSRNCCSGDAAGCTPSKSLRANSDAADRSIGSNVMAAVTYYVVLPFLQDDTGSPVAGCRGECQSSSAALRRAKSCRGPPQHRRARLQPHRRSMIGEFGDAQLLRKFGNVPDDLSGL